jgi:hypothetical protein
MPAGTIVIQTASELVHIWRQLRQSLRRDLGALGRLVADPESAFLAAGYRVDGEARQVLFASIPR